MMGSFENEVTLMNEKLGYFVNGCEKKNIQEFVTSQEKTWPHLLTIPYTVFIFHF
jgi:hypothetical protein